jgi:hypothetical protein
MIKMKLHSLRVAKYFISVLLIAGLSYSCSKDKTHPSPMLYLINDLGYLAGDTSLPIGSKRRIGIIASAADFNLTYLNVSIDDGNGKQTLLDSGFNVSSLNWSRELIKTSADIETWTITIMDKERNTSSVSIVLSKSPTLVYGNITTFNNIQLGAQNNSSIGSFFSLSTGNIYTLSQAFSAQSDIDIAYYYGTYLSTLSSPNETEAPTFFTGVNGIANWTVKNETRYDTTNVSNTAFQSSTNDSLILAVYNPIDAKRKAKYLSPGMLLSFIDHQGKLGMIEIVSLSPGDTGHVVMNIKKQQ